MAIGKELTEKQKERLKKLINKHERMLFMKGTPEYPECGFSAQMVQILESCKVKYKTFNILEDNFVREGLKIYSSWPTFPQLYVGGELIGGLDIVLELRAKQELMNYLKPSRTIVQEHMEQPEFQ